MEIDFILIYLSEEESHLLINNWDRAQVEGRVVLFAHIRLLSAKWSVYSINIDFMVLILIFQELLADRDRL